MREAWRGQSLKLVAAYANQDGIDLLINSTASPDVSKVFSFLKFSKLPQPGYDNTPFWIGRRAGFLRAALRKKGVSQVLATPCGLFLAPFLAAYLAATRRQPRGGACGLRIGIVSSDEVGPEFDDLWERKLAEGRKLWSFRTARYLRWHFGAPGKQRPPFLATAHENGRLVGYLAVIRDDNPGLGLARARVADVFVERNRTEVIRPLLATAFREARRRGAHMMEVHGLPADIRAVFAESRPHDLFNPGWPFLYRALDPELARSLEAEDQWHGGLFDGDGSL